MLDVKKIYSKLLRTDNNAKYYQHHAISYNNLPIIFYVWRLIYVEIANRMYNKFCSSIFNYLISSILQS